MEAASYSETSVTIETIETATYSRRSAGEKRVNFRQKGVANFLNSSVGLHIRICCCLLSFFEGGGDFADRLNLMKHGVSEAGSASIFI